MSTTDDAISIRHPTEDDWQAIYENQARTFGDPVGRRDVEAWTRRVKLEDILVAEDVSDPKQPFLVGTSIIYRARLTVPGGAGVQAAWLTMIAVASTHQGTGIWGQLSAQGLGILVDRGCVNDFLWVRINDVPEVLGARAYTADADFVLEVSDPLDLAGGRFLLQILEGIGKCMPHDGPPDIEIGLADLATVYMGAHRASQLLRTDRITELRPGALQELDATFTVERAP
jgi:ribosomal protein S18 acetylase RimI-like enzyme